MRELRPSIRGTLVSATLVVGILFGCAAPADAQNGGYLNACVHVNRKGDFRGELRIVGPKQRCSRSEVHIMLPLAGPDGPPEAGGGEAYEGGGIKGVLTYCGNAYPGSMAYLEGHSYVVFMGHDSSQTLTGAFEFHHVPPGKYDVALVTPNDWLLVENVQVIAGQVKDLGDVDLCFAD